MSRMSRADREYRAKIMEITLILMGIVDILQAVTLQNVIIVSKHNTNSKCKYSTQNVRTFLTHNVKTQSVITHE